MSVNYTGYPAYDCKVFVNKNIFFVDRFQVFVCSIEGGTSMPKRFQGKQKTDNKHS